MGGKLSIQNSVSPSSIQTPDKFLFNGNNLQDFIDSIIPLTMYTNPDKSYFFSNTSILCATNKNIEKINNICLTKHRGELFVLEGADEMENDNADHSLCPNEFLNNLVPSGFPLHKLKLKIGSPVILLKI